MDTLGDILEPYSECLAKFAGAVTCLQFLSGAVLINEIRKKGKSDTFPPEPFIGGTVLTLLCLKLGVLIEDSTMVQVNLIGFVINAIFMAIFYSYASEEFKKKIVMKLCVAGAFVMACLVYSCAEDPNKVEFRFGTIITAILVVLVGSPLLNLPTIIEKKSTEGLPFPIILTGAIVAGSWTLYGISIKNSVMAYQNLFLFSLSGIQLALFAIYPTDPCNETAQQTASTSNRTPAVNISNSSNKKTN